MALEQGAAPEAVPPAADELDTTVPFRVAKQRAEEQWESRYVRALLARTGDNLSEAARLVRMDRSHLRSLARKYGARGGDGA
jgi:DNA-binding NtrC family response regulator